MAGEILRTSPKHRTHTVHCVFLPNHFDVEEGKGREESGFRVSGIETPETKSPETLPRTNAGGLCCLIQGPDYEELLAAEIDHRQKIVYGGFIKWWTSNRERPRVMMGGTIDPREMCRFTSIEFSDRLSEVKWSLTGIEIDPEKFYAACGIKEFQVSLFGREPSTL